MKDQRHPESPLPDDAAGEADPAPANLVDRATDFLGRRTALPWLLLLAALLLVPRLGSFGLWDPQEVRNLDAAREVADGHLIVPERLARPPLPLVIIALGVRLLGHSEAAARMPLVLTGLLGLVAAYLAGTLLLGGSRGRRVGALNLLLLLAAPVFLLGARQVTMHLPALLGHSLAVLGLGALVAPGVGRARVAAGLLGVAGLVMAFFSLGAPLGLCAPLLAVGLALVLAQPGPGRVRLAALLCGAAGLALVPPARIVLAGFLGLQGAGASSFAVYLGGGLAAVAALLLLLGLRTGQGALLCLATLLLPLGLGLVPHLPTTTAGYSSWLGGSLRLPANREIYIDSVLKPLGFQLFPWVALLPAALATLLRPTLAPDAGPLAEDPSEARERFVRTLPLAWFGVTYLFATYQSALIGEVPFPALGALTLAVALALEPRLSERGARDPRLAEHEGRPAGDAEGPYRSPKVEPLRSAPSIFGGLLAALVLVLLSHDIGQYPELYGGSHFSEVLRWPAPMQLDLKLPRGGPMAFSQGQAVTLTLMVLTTLVSVLLAFGLALRGRLGRSLLGAGLVGCLLWTALSAHALVPLIARHVSHRGIYTKYKALGGGELALYALPRTGTRFYEQSAVELASVSALFDFLGKYPGAPPSKRVFAMVGAQELAPIDQFARQGGKRYFVLDDSNAQSLLLSNLLRPGEVDLNPLRRLVLDQAPTPRVPLKVRFEDRVELIGYDIPPEITRGQDYVVRLYFKVLAPLGGTYKIFMHFDGPGSRVNGDHVPLDGKFPTSYWVPGSYIIDEHLMSSGRMAQPAGSYNVFFGFWPGGDSPRLKVQEGPHDGEHRVKLGMMKVK